jgi:hypothetical protein
LGFDCDRWPRGNIAPVADVTPAASAVNEVAVLGNRTEKLHEKLNI